MVVQLGPTGGFVLVYKICYTTNIDEMKLGITVCV